MRKIYLSFAILFFLFNMRAGAMTAAISDTSFLVRGNIKLKNGDFLGAINDYDKHIEADPKNIEAIFNRGLAWTELGDNESAIEDFSAVLDSDHHNARAYIKRGHCKAHLGDHIRSHRGLFKSSSSFSKRF